MTHEALESDKGECRVCHGPAAGLYFGALVCLPCKSFYIRCTKDGVKLRCQQDVTACTVNKGRFKCQACRFEACLKAGMQRKEEKPDVINAPAGSVMCKVCDDFANGVHFGVTSCEGCKKFFRRGLTEYQNYSCKEGGNCPITPRTRNQCRYCRYMACLKAGMSREAIKVGRPPSKKENSRHHPYGQISLSTSHHETSPKLYTNGNGFMKQEVPWAPSEPHSLASLPALIHGGGEGFRRPQQASMKIAERQISNDLNTSCTSTDINEMLLSCLGPNGEMAPLPPHFDLDEALGQIDGPHPPNLMSPKQPKLQRIENLPAKQHHHQGYQQSRAEVPWRDGAFDMGHGKANFQLHPHSYPHIKSENTNYREPIQTYSHPSPPYEASYEANHSPPSMYQQNYPTSQHSHGSPYSQSMSNHGSPLNTLAQQNKVMNQAVNGYGMPIPNHGSPQQQTSPYDMSTGGHMAADPSTNQQLINGDSSPYRSPNRQQAMIHSGPIPFAEMRTQRPSCDVVAQQIQHDPNSPYAQQQYSPYSSCTSSPQSSPNTSGYATDSQDFMDEFSIYEVDIRQVNHKYMPSCSHEPLIFNEQALTVEDLWSKNTKKEEDDWEERSQKDMETGESLGSGMFKHMKSIDDKVDQEYWFTHQTPEDVEYGEEMKTEMESLMRGWFKTKEYVSGNLKTHSTSQGDEGKESLWPNVKENAPLQLKLMDFIKNRLIRETQAQARFYQEIKGSDTLPEKDKKTLVSTASFSNCLLMHVLYWWDEEREQCRYFWAWRIPEKDPFYVFRQTVLKFSRAIKDMNFDEKEIMLLSALTLFSTDILRIEQKDVIEKERKPLTNLCAAYMKDKYKDSYMKRYHEMLAMVPALRYLSIWHNDLMAFAKTFGPITDRSKSKTSESSELNKDYESSVNMIKQLQIQE